MSLFSTIGRGIGDTIEAAVTSPLRTARWLREWTRWWWVSRSRRWMLIGIMTSLLVAVSMTRISRLELRFAQAAMDRVEVAEAIYLPPPVALRLMSLGHEPFLSDVMFARANIYFAAHLFGDRSFPLLEPYTEAILSLDPDNLQVYQWASQGVKYAQFISHDVLETSNEYARRGIERFPDYWRFYFDIGFNYTVEWWTDDPAEAETMRQRAVPYFSVAAALPGSELDPNFVSALYLDENEVEMALFHAYLRYREASDREKAALRARITRYESEATARLLEEHDVLWKKAFPYMPFGLYERLGGAPSMEARGWATLDDGQVEENP